jgi:glycerol-3-phosphate acyltransferase PlsY
MNAFLILCLCAYLAGSIPFGLIIGKTLKGIDLRDHGSGNIGATNAGRVLGYRWGLLCLVLDALKGLLPVMLFPPYFFATDDPNMGHARVLAGIATIIGHMFSCFLGFRGGKGVATSLGVLLMLSPKGLLVAVVIFALSLLIWRYVSLSSILAAVGYGSYELIRLSPSPFSATTWSQAVFAIAVPVLIVIQHRSNIRRLMKGEELKLTRKKPSPQT